MFFLQYKYKRCIVGWTGGNDCGLEGRIHHLVIELPGNI